MKFLDYKVSGQLTNSNYIHKNGFFIGNYPKNLDKELRKVYNIIIEELKNEKALIFGVTGQDGYYLTDLLLKKV